MELLRFLLYPFALIYGTVIFLRNKLFDWKVLRSVVFPFPVISVGNLAVGGVGKTPLVEYIVRLLQAEYKLAILSRGYRRKSKGYIKVSPEDDVFRAGDEPLQYSRKFPEITVAVDEKRRHGIRQLMAEVTGLEVVVLDDAFQHRYVKPGLSILVTDYHRLYSKDHLLPAGRLREYRRASNRANIIVVSKTPKIFSPLVRRQIIEELRPNQNQLVSFSYISYEEWIPLYPSGLIPDADQRKVISILMVSGIANPAPMEEYLRSFCSDLTKLTFSDHHTFTSNELRMIRDTFIALPTRKKIIITTEKDAARLRRKEAESILGELPVYYLPIRFAFHPQDKAAFDTALYELMNPRKS